MLIAKLEIWHNDATSGKPIRSFLGFYRGPFGDMWEVSPAFPALGAERGFWQIGYTGGGKGTHRTRVIEIRDPKKAWLATIPTFENWNDSTLAMGWGYHFPTDCKVRAAMTPAKEKPFRIRVTSQFGVSLAVVQTEGMCFEIEDVNAKQTAKYGYNGSGFTLSVPGPKAGSAVRNVARGFMKQAGKGSLSEGGPWNDFTAPGWLTAFNFEGDAGAASPYSIGMGTSNSWTILRFGHEYRVELTNFSGGSTWALPGAGFSNGTMTLLKQ